MNEMTMYVCWINWDQKPGMCYIYDVCIWTMDIYNILYVIDMIHNISIIHALSMDQDVRGLQQQINKIGARMLLVHAQYFPCYTGVAKRLRHMLSPKK